MARCVPCRGYGVLDGAAVRSRFQALWDRVRVAVAGEDWVRFADEETE
jgi:hypothetical protein